MVDDDRAEYVRRLIAARCPGLSEADLAALAERDPDTSIPAESGEKIADVIDHMLDRLDALERRLPA